MGPWGAIRTLPYDVFRFRGRASRSEYVWKICLILLTCLSFIGAQSVVLVGLSHGPVRLVDLVFSIDRATGLPRLSGFLVPSALFFLAYAIPLEVRRFRDTGAPAWAYFLFMALVPILRFDPGISSVGVFIGWAMRLYIVGHPSMEMVEETYVRYLPGRQDELAFETRRRAVLSEE